MDLKSETSSLYPEGDICNTVATEGDLFKFVGFFFAEVAKLCLFNGFGDLITEVVNYYFLADFRFFVDAICVVEFLFD